MERSAICTHTIQMTILYRRDSDIVHSNSLLSVIKQSYKEYSTLDVTNVPSGHENQRMTIFFLKYFHFWRCFQHFQPLGCGSAYSDRHNSTDKSILVIKSLSYAISKDFRCSYQVLRGITQDKTLYLFPYAKLPQNADIHNLNCANTPHAPAVRKRH